MGGRPSTIKPSGAVGFGNQDVSVEGESSLMAYHQRDIPQDIKAATGDILKCFTSFEPFLQDSTGLSRAQPVAYVGSWVGYVLLVCLNNLYFISTQKKYQNETAFVVCRGASFNVTPHSIKVFGNSLYLSHSHTLVRITPRNVATFDLFQTPVFDFKHYSFTVGGKVKSSHDLMPHVYVQYVDTTLKDFVEYQGEVCAINKGNAVVYQLPPRPNEPAKMQEIRTVPLMDTFLHLDVVGETIVASGPTSFTFFQSSLFSNPTVNTQGINCKGIFVIPHYRSLLINFSPLSGKNVYQENNTLSLVAKGSIPKDFSSACIWSNRFAVSDKFGMIYLYDFNCQEDTKWKAHKYEIDHIAVWQAWLVSAGTDLEIKIWNKSLECIITSKTKNRVTQLDFCDNYLVTGDFHGSVRVLEMYSTNIKLLLLARYFCPECPFYKDTLPNDMFKEIISRI